MSSFFGVSYFSGDEKPITHRFSGSWVQDCNIVLYLSSPLGQHTWHPGAPWLLSPSPSVQTAPLFLKAGTGTRTRSFTSSVPGGGCSCLFPRGHRLSMSQYPPHAGLPSGQVTDLQKSPRYLLGRIRGAYYFLHKGSCPS